ncbi:MAG: circularly permuted type 2 ATP-grasp protein [Acidimicrobiales bacterium]
MTTATTADPAGGDVPAARGAVTLGYSAVPGRADEYLSPDGTVRTRWKRLAAEAAGLGPAGLLARRAELARLLRNEGATYNARRDGHSVRQPWSLDPYPLVVEKDEWHALESAVAQRVSLLDLVLADLYGDRRLVADGLIPAELVLGHPAFLRPCAGMEPHRTRRLFLGAVDVVRDRHGEFRATGDRAQVPSGLGYALVNRTILSRVLPNLHRESGVERLAGFFRSIRSGIASVAPEGVEEARVVILTPGPLSETYFEHAYLASYLGYPLVEGSDLVVHNNRLWLRSLAGFDPVDVVLRRVDDRWCDPVELRTDSLLGVPGLLEVARGGRVAVVNPLGAGVLEDPALTGLLGRLAPVVLGEELALRGPDTWWCGDPTHLGHVLAELEHLVVLPVRPSPSTPPVAGATLSHAELEALRDQIRSHPAAWVGQEVIAGSTAPTVTDEGTLEPRPVVLRTFAVADGTVHRGGGDEVRGFSVMPGGLTRVGAGVASLIISSRGGGTSKDTWVASPEPALQQSTWLRSARTVVRPPVVPEPASLLPGRVAAQLFVLGRTAEHAELVIRLIRTVLARLDQPLGVGVDGGAESLQVLLAALGAVTGFDPVSEPDERAPQHPGPAPAAPRPDVPTDRRALALLLDAGVDGSLVSSLALLVDAAYSVREQLSGDTWQLVGDVEEELARLRSRPPAQLVGVQSGLQRLLQALLALAGLSAENMERDSAWLFLDAGRRLERAQSLIRLLRAVLVRRRPGVVEDLLLESLLKTSESLMIFRRRSGPMMQVADGIDLLVYDADNPRSVIYQLDRLVEHLSDLPRQSPGQRFGDEEQLVLETVTLLRRTDAGRLAEFDDDAGRRPELDMVLGQVDGLLADLLDSLRHTYFAHERLSVLSGRTPERSDEDRP